jgi:hypothetical protein
MEVKAAHVSRLRQHIQAGNFLRLFDQPARRRHGSSLPVGAGGFIRAAAFARPKSRPFGVGGGLVERDILAPGQARRARWTAINAGRVHRIDEGAVRRAIAPLQSVPARVVAGRGHRFRARCHQMQHRPAPSGWYGTHGSASAGAI